MAVGFNAGYPTVPNANTTGAQNVWNFTNMGDPSSVISYSYIVPFPTSNARNSGFKLNFTLSSDFATRAAAAPDNTPWVQ